MLGLERAKAKMLGTALLAPMLLVLVGVLLDYVTIVAGLGLGYCEASPSYCPLKALFILTAVTVMLTHALPDKRPWTFVAKGPAILPYLAALNNMLVMLAVL